MSSPCAVCGLPGEPLKTVKGFPLELCPSPGAACSPECATFILVRPNDETPDEKRITSWEWRRRRADARGQPFDEPQPMTEVDRAVVLRLREWRTRYGWEPSLRSTKGET